MSKKKELEDTITEAQNSAKKSVDGYVALAKKANEHLNAAEPADAGDWVNLTATAYGRLAGDAAKLWSTGFAVLDILAKDE